MKPTRLRIILRFSLSGHVGIRNLYAIAGGIFPLPFDRDLFIFFFLSLE
jgi:hypothetical protein